jgi:DNA adenine methylase
MSKKKLNFFSYMGGKHLILNKLLKLIPSHKIYVEPFGGSGKLLLNKIPAQHEVYNDADIRIANLFYVVAHRFEEFNEKVNRLVYARAIYDKIFKEADNVKELGDVDRAVSFYFRIKSTFASKITSKSFAYSFTDSQASRYFNGLRELPYIHERLKNVLTLNNDYDIILSEYVNNKDVFIYSDPPYFNAEHYYNAKFSLEDHKKMLGLLKQAQCKWLLSGYANDLYDEELKDFYRLEIPSVKPSYGITEANKNTTNKRPEALEILWSNYPIKL